MSVEAYLSALWSIRGSGAAVPETSGYGAIAALLDTAGARLSPRVRCLIGLRQQGAGLPDAGFFTSDQFPRSGDATPKTGQLPSRGVMEVKSTRDDVAAIARSPQVAGYLGRYGLVLVTNYRDFVLVDAAPDGSPRLLERYALAPSEADFWRSSPHELAEQHGDRLLEYLTRCLMHAAPLRAPRDVAFILASYARDARSRVEAQRNLPALAALRASLEQSLGITFEGDRGEHFFRSTLVQTLFYGVFSAWVLWHSEQPDRTDRFSWRMAGSFLHLPVLQSLFSQVTQQSRLRALGLLEVLDWADAALARVVRASFFDRFEEGAAVQFFYEPFLEAFDPELRRELGVWYTPTEIVKYQVARVDHALREELGIADGLADPRVYILDPCCGTGAYLAEVVNTIAETLRARGDDDLLGYDLKQAIINRVYGFELLPAPFVVAHLQIGLLLQRYGARLQVDERAAVYLTNALTGWEPPTGPRTMLMFPELEAERDAANHIKRDVPILVVLGNPPYNSFAGLAIGEERDLSTAYRTTRAAPAPQGQGLNDLYVRFYRMAERRIVEGTGQGIVCYISNYSWLDGLSFTGMRERYAEVFDEVWIDNLNGDKFRTGKRTPDGQPDPSVFSTDTNREGIGIGTAIALLVRRQHHTPGTTIHYRSFWGRSKRADLLTSLDNSTGPGYQTVTPPLALGLPFSPLQASADYLSWPKLPELLPVASPGVNTSRDADLVAIDRHDLEQRIAIYFNSQRSDADVARDLPAVMATTGRYDAPATRRILLQKGQDSGFIMRYCYRPFDTRWLYWHPETKLIDEKREDLFVAAQAGNWFMTSRSRAERDAEGTPFFMTRLLADRHLTRPGSACFHMLITNQPARQHSIFDDPGASGPRANLSATARAYLADIGIPDPDADLETAGLLWWHALAIGHSPAYLRENSDPLRQDWPRIPLPASSEVLRASAALGQQVAALLDEETPVAGVTAGTVVPALRELGRLRRADGSQVQPQAGDLAIAAGWGVAGRAGITMPGRGRITERDYTDAEGAAIGNGLVLLGVRTFDVWLNDRTCWHNTPTEVWEYRIGGYQVLKKWLSFRERTLLERDLTPEEARLFSQLVRRIAALLLLGPQLDANYRASAVASTNQGGESI